MCLFKKQSAFSSRPSAENHETGNQSEGLSYLFSARNKITKQAEKATIHLLMNQDFFWRRKMEIIEKLKQDSLQLVSLEDLSATGSLYG